MVVLTNTCCYKRTHCSSSPAAAAATECWSLQALCCPCTGKQGALLALAGAQSSVGLLKAQAPLGHFSRSDFAHSSLHENTVDIWGMCIECIWVNFHQLHRILHQRMLLPLVTRVSVASGRCDGSTYPCLLRISSLCLHWRKQQQEPCRIVFLRVYLLSVKHN